MTALDRDQLLCLLDETDGHPLHALVVLLATSGLRVGEALALRLEDIDLDTRRLHVRRTLRRQRRTGVVIGPPKTTSCAGEGCFLLMWRLREPVDSSWRGPSPTKSVGLRKSFYARTRDAAFGQLEDGAWLLASQLLSDAPRLLWPSTSLVSRRHPLHQSEPAPNRRSGRGAG